MLALATPVIDGSALWKIILVSLVAGAGSAIAFGFALLGLARAQDAENGGVKLLNYTLFAVCALYVLAAIVFGLYAMLHKS